MARTTKKSLTVTVFVLLFVLNIFLQMLLSGERLDRLMVEVFTTWTGLINLIAATILWFFYYFFTPMAFYILGLIIAMEFLILPLMIRYRYLTFNPNIFVSVLAAFYVLLFYRIMLVVFG